MKNWKLKRLLFNTYVNNEGIYIYENEKTGRFMLRLENVEGKYKDVEIEFKNEEEMERYIYSDVPKNETYYQNATALYSVVKKMMHDEFGPDRMGADRYATL